MLHAATTKLVAAKKVYESTKLRNDLITNFIRATFAYMDARRDAAGHAALVQWVLEQVPLVEAELVQADMTVAGPDTKSGKRKRFQDDANPEEHCQKKRKPGQTGLPRLSRCSGTGPSDLGQACQSPSRTVLDKHYMTRDDTRGRQSRQADSTRSVRFSNASPAPTQGRRRSARIAARQSHSQPTSTVEHPRQLRPRSRAEPRQNLRTSHLQRRTGAAAALKIGTRERQSSAQVRRMSKRLARGK
ncbi:hypothetical protein Purlil1_13269 [Purpureocillium lilacinum]|uniref:Uncharacterized protein n=1 Tax=Purpureocillium lilacinum TaxID=33203 RepID=A0ABR0BEI6_PURLI|nr:hypothetical protein Purlil1_13269 [Purpureocillium lilacinum]